MLGRAWFEPLTCGAEIILVLALAHRAIHTFFQVWTPGFASRAHRSYEGEGDRGKRGENNSPFRKKKCEQQLTAV